MLRSLCVILAVNQASWIDYNPLDHSAETVQGHYHIPEISEDPLHSARSVRYDDGWEVYRRPPTKPTNEPSAKPTSKPTAHPTKTPTSKPTKRPLYIQVNKTIKNYHEKKANPQSMHQLIARQITQQSVSHPTQRPTQRPTKPKPQKLCSNHISHSLHDYQTPTKLSNSKRTKPRHRDLSSSNTPRTPNAIIESPTISCSDTKRKQHKLINIHIFDDTKWKKKDVAEFESELIALEPNSAFILSSTPKDITAKHNRKHIFFHTHDIDVAIYTFATFMTKIQSFYFPLQLKEFSQWVVLALSDLAKLPDDTFRSILKKLKLAYLKANKCQRELLSLIQVIYQIVSIPDHTQREKRLQSKMQSLDKLIAAEYIVISDFFSISFRTLFRIKLGEFAVYYKESLLLKMENDLWLWQEYDTAMFEEREAEIDECLHILLNNSNALYYSRRANLHKDMSKKRLAFTIWSRMDNDLSKMKNIRWAYSDMKGLAVAVWSSMRTFYISHTLIKWKYVPSFDAKDVHIVIRQNDCEEMLDESLKKMGYSKYVKKNYVGYKPIGMYDMVRVFVKGVLLGLFLFVIYIKIKIFRGH